MIRTIRASCILPEAVVQSQLASSQDGGRRQL